MPSKRKNTAKKRRPLRPTPKPRVIHQIDATPISPNDIRLVRTKGTKGRGGGPGGEAWRIDAEGKRSGVVFINFIDELPVGPHASIQIYLNVQSQGRKIGRVGYERACKESQYDTIYAHMRKANIASIKAAEAAGFVLSATTPSHQVIYVRHRR